MITVLFSAACIPAGGLDMTLRTRANPNILPYRGNNQRTNAPEHGVAAHFPAPCIGVNEGTSAPESANSGLPVMDSTQSDRSLRGGEQDTGGRHNKLPLHGKVHEAEPSAGSFPDTNAGEPVVRHRQGLQLARSFIRSRPSKTQAPVFPLRL